MSSAIEMLFYLTLIILIFNPYFGLSFPADEVTKLPGLAKQPSFKHYSGYLNATTGRYYHYWFTESQSNPEKDPVILWLNGGPGCSSLSGFFTENGPFRVLDNGTVTEDPYSWNTLGNVIFLESPVGVGFSYSDNKTFRNSDDLTAEDNYLALESFFKKFPQFSKNEFYITGESYAGVYIPTLALKIKESNSTINLKGLAIGNGALNMSMFSNSRVRMAYTHGLIDSAEWNQLVETCCSCSNNSIGQVCDFASPTKRACNVANQIRSKVTNYGINPYNILSDCQSADFYSTDKRFSNSRLYFDLNRYFGVDFDDMNEIDKYYASRPPCVSSKYNSYVDLPEVREAIHIPTHVQKWLECSSVHYEENYDNMKSQVKQLVDKYKIERFIIFNGDIDIVCDFLGDQQFVDELGYKLVEKYQKWTVNGRIAGFVKRYEGISFLTVRGAGHMVPTDQPEAALKIIKELIGVGKVEQ